MPFRWRTTVLLILAACAHDLAPDPGAPGVDTIPDVGPPERLTLNPGKDATPQFAPDGRSVWYAWERLDRADRDLCIGRLPIGGGTRTNEICHPTAAANPDSVNWYFYPTPHPDGRRLAWFRLSALRSAQRGYAGELVMASIADPEATVGIDDVQIFPTQVAPGHFHEQPERLQWLNDSTLVYLAVQVVVLFNRGLPQDTLYSGFEIGSLTISDAGVRMGFVPGTERASGLTIGPGGSLYFTRNGENLLYRTSLAGGSVDTLFDFGPGTTIVRDPVYVDGVVYAVVDGDVTYQFFENLGNLQSDGGGPLWRATPTSRELVDNSHRWRHPSLSPDGSTLVVEGRDIVTGINDLFLLRIN